jgi:MFS family permease
MNSVSKRLSFGLAGNLRLLFYTIFLWELGFGFYYNNLLTIYMKELGLSEASTGTLLTVGGIFRIVLMLPVGSLMDHIGRKPVILVANLIAIPGALAYAFADGWPLLLIATICMAVNALGFPAMSGIIADSDSANPTDVFRKLYTVGPAIAFIIGPLVGGQIAEVISQEAVFIAVAAVFGGALLLAINLHEPPMHNRGSRRGTYLDVVRYRPMRLVVIYGFAIVFMMTFGVTFLPNLVTDAHGFSDQQRGLAFSFGALGTLALSIFMSRTAWVTHIRGIFIGVACVTLICLIPLLVGNPWLLIPAFMMRGGLMMSWSLLTPLASDMTPKHLQERSFAGIEFATGVGSTIAPVAAGIAYEIGRSTPFVIGAIALPILALLGVLLERRVIAPEISKRSPAPATASYEPAPS